ncbi:hypothetical protein [Micromonospora lupini]|uniref:Asparaginase/glutaminase C-terminal domain-containing protein n=1 Tax=Micromonospora lupini str. Lupac 08 TaxID=1150864 RepID=I0KYV0_9ACTN|nr:hypothetical protein [Micromonospora lupini]CCH16747.1 Conserved hypothetical protein [Micromonospora lupini str. Lupac 08]
MCHQAVPPIDPDRLDATQVALCVVTLDDDGPLLRGLADTHQGLVVAGFGVGHVPATLAPVLGKLAGRMPVVLTSRSGSGSVLRHKYGAVGSETDLQRRGCGTAGCSARTRPRCCCGCCWPPARTPTS